MLGKSFRLSLLMWNSYTPLSAPTNLLTDSQHEAITRHPKSTTYKTSPSSLHDKPAVS